MLKDAFRCTFCGECESSCPTLKTGYYRYYGPRGRVYYVKSILEKNKDWRLTPIIEESLYTCLLCGACSLVCPLHLNIPEVIRLVRNMLWVKHGG